MSVREIRHPLIRHKLGIMRHKNISTRAFRDLTGEVGSLLTYEATSDLDLECYTVETWSGPTEAMQIRGKKITVVSILPAGPGMLDAVLNMVSNAKVSVVELYRDEETLQPVTCFEKPAGDIDQRMALIVHPMLATGGTMNATIDMLKKAGCKKIRALVLVSAPEGIDAVVNRHPDVDVYTAAIDDRLDDNGCIVPGLGDAGDKIFGTK